VRAALVRKLPAAAFEVTDADEPEPSAADELLVAVEACGICGTDLHILEGDSYRPEVPFVLGHEPVGVVIAAGETARDWLGRRVTITLFSGCGSCRLCLSGDERLCADLRSITGVVDSWGGFAERLLVRAAQAVEVPDALTSAEAAVLVDAGATALNGARVALRHGGERFLVAGGGPVGFLVAECLRAAAHDVFVVEPQRLRREALARLGHQTATTLDEAPTPDVVLDCAGRPEVFAFALERLASRGLFVAIGYGHVPAIDLAPVARKELTIRGVRSGSRIDLEEALELAASGAIHLPALSTWSIEEINNAFRALRAGEVAGKAVIVFGHRKERNSSTS
jgi:2-desacetyl-2-hydroxyethyl bacteriochlorophyllide A dehydrogenase